MTLFDGITIDPELDNDRLAGQLGRVFRALQDGRWWTLAELVAVCGGSEAGVSARIRDLRKAKFGGYDVARRRRWDATRGLWEYRLNRGWTCGS